MYAAALRLRRNALYCGIANITIPVKDVKLNGSSTVKDGIAELEIDTSAFNVHTIPLTTTLTGDITDVGEHDILQFDWLFQLKNQGMYQNVIPRGSNDAPNILYIPKAGSKGWSGGITELKNIDYQDQGQAQKFKSARYFLPYGLSNVEGALQADLFTELYIVVPKQDDPAEPGSDDESTYYAIEDGYALTLTATNCSKTIAYKRIPQDDIDTARSESQPVELPEEDTYCRIQ